MGINFSLRRCHLRNFLFNFTVYIHCASSLSVDSFVQHGSEFHQTTSLSDSFLSKYFPIWLLYLLKNKQNIRNSSWFPKLRVSRSGFSPVWKIKCFLRSEWERAENGLLPTMSWKVKVMKLWKNKMVFACRRSSDIQFEEG